jgi:hypothetical protein
MAADPKSDKKAKAEHKPKPDQKPAKQAKPAKDAPAKDKAKKQPDPPAAAEAPTPKPPPPPRDPADPRLKFLKKFRGRFLPKGPLRDRWIEINTRWNSADDHGGVSVEELKQLLDDWKTVRAKKRKPVAS